MRFERAPHSEDLQRQVEYWRGLAAYLASCHAATAEYDGTLKGISKSRQKRLRDICVTCVMGLSGRWHKKHDSDGDVAAALRRCEQAGAQR